MFIHLTKGQVSGNFVYSFLSFFSNLCLTKIFPVRYPAGLNFVSDGWLRSGADGISCRYVGGLVYKVAILVHLERVSKAKYDLTSWQIYHSTWVVKKK